MSLVREVNGVFEPVTTKRWAVWRNADKLGTLKITFLEAQQRDIFQGTNVGQTYKQSVRQKWIVARYDTLEQAEAAVQRGRAAWERAGPPVWEAQRALRAAEADRERIMVEAINGKAEIFA